MKLQTFSLLAATASAALTTDYEWQAWKNSHKISFPTRQEEMHRYGIFIKSREFVREHNLRAAEGKETYTVGLNKFAALTEDEFANNYLNEKMADRLNHAVTATGFGNLGGVDYFEIKNSWGAEWGDQGYINIERGVGMCGLGVDSMYNLA